MTANPIQDPVPGSLFGERQGLYQARSTNFLVSFLAHLLAIAVVLALSNFVVNHHDAIKSSIDKVVDSAPLIFTGKGGGGGGDGNKFQASHGALPKLSLEDQLAPPTVIVRAEHPALPVEPTIIVAPDVQLVQGNQMGDPLSKILGPPSNGPGHGGGIGDGCCGGVGPGKGPGFGPGPGGVRLAGRNGVTVPRVVYDPDPEYSDPARKAKLQGSVVLWVVVGPDGRPRDVRVQRALGLGLDEKALEAVKNWRFEPATLDGQAVAVQVNVEVNFRLY